MGQVFIYVLAAVIFSLILLFGYKAINNFVTRSKEVALIDLKNDVQSAVNSIASSPDVEKRTLQIPSSYQKICFFENVSEAYPDQTCLCDESWCAPEQDDTNPMLCQIWKDGTRQNVYLLPLADIEIVVGKIVLDDDYLCLPVVKGKVELRLEGMGDATRITAWTS